MQHYMFVIHFYEDGKLSSRSNSLSCARNPGLGLTFSLFSFTRANASRSGNPRLFMT